MKKIILILSALFSLSGFAASHSPFQADSHFKSFSNRKAFPMRADSVGSELKDGDVFTGLTPEGIEMTFSVRNASNKTCWVESPAIDISTSGPVTIPSSVNGYEVKGIHPYAFWDCDKLTSVVVPEGVDSITYGAFAECHSLSQIKLPNSLTFLWSYAFYGCTNLASVSLGNQLETIGEAAFYGCTSLKSLELPSSLTYIGSSAFRDCSSLTEMHIPENVRYLEEWLFAGSCGVKKLTVDANNPYFYSSNNCILADANVNGETVGLVRFGCAGSTIPNDARVKLVGPYALGAIYGLKEILIPDNITSIGQNAFSYCLNLEKITIGKNVNIIQSFAFSRNANLKQVYALNPVPVDITDNVFHNEVVYNEDGSVNTSGNFTTATLYVPAGSKAAYQKANGWKNFQNIVEIEEQNDSEGDEDAFYIYRNDGQFNAFFCNEIDSIGYSHYDADGKYYEENVAQLVYTPDSIYSIPLAVIDSVAFQVNELTISDAYQPIEDDSYIIISADIEKGEYVLQFNGTVPDIEEGNVLTIMDDEIYEIVRVHSVKRSGQLVTIMSEQASLGDIFTSGSFTLSTEQPTEARRKNYMPGGSRVFYPSEISFRDDSGQRRRIKYNGPNRVEFDHNLFNYTIDYSGQELYKNDYVNLYVETLKMTLDLDLIISCNFNSFEEGFGKWLKGELAAEKAVLRGSAGTDFMLRFDAKGKKKEDLDEVLLKKQVHEPRVVDFVVVVDGVEVPVKVLVDTKLLGFGSYEAEGEFSAYSGYSTSIWTELGLSWSQADGIKPYSDYGCSYTIHNPTIEGNAHLEEKIGVFPRITCSVYGLLGPSFDIKPYLRQTFDFGFKDDLAADDEEDFYAAEYNMYGGVDAALGMTFLSALGNEPFAKTPSFKVFEAHLYEAPKGIKCEKAPSEFAVAGKPIEVSFRVTDQISILNKDVPAAFAMPVKFETNCGTLSSIFSLVDTDSSLATIIWTPANETNDGAEPYIKATIHDHEGKVITSDKWKPLFKYQVSVETLPAKEITTSSAVLGGHVAEYYVGIDDGEVGFYYNTAGNPVESGNKVVIGRLSEFFNGDFYTTLSGLKPEQEYSYLAYYSDENGTVFGKVQSFTTLPDVKQAYAVLEGDVLTFYYDEKQEEREGIIYTINKMSSIGSSVKKVVFSPSFADYRPTTTARWFERFGDLEEIVNIHYLNTENVTDMSGMFNACHNLTSLDLSSFNTSNVTNMSGMFSYCHSLKSLDLSSFNTSNVTNMRDMFEFSKSLMSLELSSFDTRNVTSMSMMFADCLSLTNLDLSSFDTRNVTSMSMMFYECRSLTNLDLSNFDTRNVTNMYGMFRDCRSLTTLDLSNFDTGNVTSMRDMFRECYELEYLDIRNFKFSSDLNLYMLTSLKELNISNVDTSELTSMDGLFRYCRSLTRLDLSSFDTSNVTSMAEMFLECNSLKSVDLSSFDTSNVTNMDYMFSGCGSLTSLDLSNFDTEKVTSMKTMFNECTKLAYLDIRNFKLSADFAFSGLSSLKELNISNVDTSELTSMEKMFQGCSSLTTLDLGIFGTGTVSNMGYMFSGCSSLTDLDLSSFDTRNVTNMGYMFSGCSSLTDLDLSSFDTKNVTNMEYMFQGCSSLTDLDLSSFDTGNVTSMENMFDGCSGLTSFDMSNLNMENVSIMYNMFSGCSSLQSLSLSSLYFRSDKDDYWGKKVTLFGGCGNLKELNVASCVIESSKQLDKFFGECESIETIIMQTGQLSGDVSYLFSGRKTLKYLDIIGLDTSGATSMSNMFSGCSSLICLDLSSFDTKNVTSMRDMFYNCSNLEYLDIRNSKFSSDLVFSNLSSLKELDISNVDTSELTSTNNMFSGCSSLTSLDLSSFNTGNVTSMSSMFSGCSSLISLDLSSFDTKNVTSMNSMFSGCSSLTSLDLSSFDTGNVANMESTLFGCSSLTDLDLSNFDTGNVTSMRSLFSGCSSLTSLDLSNFDTGNVTNMESMFSGCSSLLSFDLTDFDTEKVTYISYMFSDCSSIHRIYSNKNLSHLSGYGMFSNCNNLVGGKGTKIGQNLYGFDEKDNPLYYYCPTDGSAAHIDGGKDNPGLFTAK